MTYAEARAALQFGRHYVLWLSAMLQLGAVQRVGPDEFILVDDDPQKAEACYDQADRLSAGYIPDANDVLALILEDGLRAGDDGLGRPGFFNIDSD